METVNKRAQDCLKMAATIPIGAPWKGGPSVPRAPDFCSTLFV